MTICEEGMALTKHFEGCRLEAYQDQAGFWTIGYGHTAGVKEGDTCTQDQAEAWLAEDIKASGIVVNSCVKTWIEQHHFDALVDFVFNLGSWNFASSTLLKKLNAGDYEGAAAEFPKWNKVSVNGVLQVDKGLTRRRLAEQAMFLGQDWKEERKA